MVTKALLMSLLMWISAHSPYDMTHARLPRVEYHAQYELNHLIYGDTECAGRTPPNIVAAYTPRSNEDDGAVHLRETFNSNDPEDISTLVHELTHHGQHTYESRAPKTSVGREKEAIKTENKWRDAHGLRKIDRIVSANLCE